MLVARKVALTILLVFVSSLFLTPKALPPLHAATATGEVCITISTTATTCPASPPTVGPLTVGSTFDVGVFIQGSAPMGGFDIYVASNPAFVNPTGAALGTLITSPSLTSICVNGSAQTEACTANSANGPGVVEVTTINENGDNECGGISPCSGMAFTITYQVVGAVASTDLSYPSAAGCSNSSVSQPPNVCVLVADAFGTTLFENIQGATVTQAVAQFDYSLSNNGPVSIHQGSSGTVTITATLTAGSAQAVTLSCSGLPSGITCGSFTVNPVTPTATSNLPINVAASVAAGSYTFMVTGSPVGATASGATTTVSVTVSSVTFDYSLSNNGPVSIVQSGSGTVTIRATLTAATAQPVTLSCVIPLSTGITCGSFSVNPVTPTASGAISNLPISVASSVIPGSYTLQVTGTPAGTTVSAATTTVSVTVFTLTAGPDFTLTASPTSVTVSVGVAGTSTITFGPLNGFTGDVSLISDNASCSLTPATVSGGSGTSILSCTFASTGSFVVTVTGTSGSLVHTAAVDFTVTAAAGFDLSWQGYDWDGGREETVYLNGNAVASLPLTDVGGNGGAWASFSLDITSFLVQGPNMLTFAHAGWDCGIADNVSDLLIANGSSVVYSNSASLPLSCAQSLTYTFTIGTAQPPPPPPPLTLTESFDTANPIAGETCSFRGLASGGVPPYSFSWDFGDSVSGFGSSVTHIYTAPGTYAVTLTVRDSASPSSSTLSVTGYQTVSAPPPPSAGTYTLSWQGYDWDGGGEETIALNGLIITALPGIDTPSNGAAWAPFSLNVTSYVVTGTNTLTFTHANWDCSISDYVRNLQVKSGTTVIYSNPDESPLSCTQTLTYTFTG